MARSQMRYTVTRNGRPVQNALVTVYEQATTTPVPDMYAAASGGSPITTLTSNSNGVVVGYFDNPRVVDLLVSDNSRAAYYPQAASNVLGWAPFTVSVSCPPSSVGPSVVMSTAPGLVGLTTWPSANLASFSRCVIPAARTYRYFLFRTGTQVGNIQVGVVRLSGAGLTDYERVMSSGVIAAPAAGDHRLDLGATLLQSGDYALFVWADNTSISYAFSTSANFSPIRQNADVSGLTSGVPSSGSGLAWNGTKLFTIGLEAA